MRLYIWWRVAWDFTSHNRTSHNNTSHWRVVRDFTSHNSTSHHNTSHWRHKKEEGWCETLHHTAVHHMGLVLGRKPEHETLCFLGNVASAGDEDERYLVCAAGGAAAVVPDANRFSLGVLPRLVIHVCVVLCASWMSGCRSQCNGCVILVMFCGHVRRYMRVSQVMLQNSWESWIVLEWLHQGCDSDLSLDFLNLCAGDFPFKIPFKKCFNVVFFALALGSGFGAAISVVITCQKCLCVKTSLRKSLLLCKLCTTK